MAVPPVPRAESGKPVAEVRRAEADAGARGDVLRTEERHGLSRLGADPKNR